MVALATLATFTDSLFSHIQEDEPVPAPTLKIDEPSRRDHTIELILQTNRSATRPWLDRFDDEALHQYLAHLQASQTPRGRMAFWVRSTAAPAITMADAPE